MNLIGKTTILMRIFQRTGTSVKTHAMMSETFMATKEIIDRTTKTAIMVNL